MLTRIGVATGSEQIQPLRDPLEDLRGGKHAGPRGGKLDCQRQVVETAAQLGHRIVRLDAGPRGEQLRRLCLCESRDLVDDLTVDPQPLPARDEHAQVRTSLQQGRKLDR